MDVRVERVADQAKVKDLYLSAFGDRGRAVSDLVETLRHSVTADNGLSLVAADGQQIVGHAMLTRSLLDTPRKLLEVQVLSPVAVLPTRQRQNTGSTLIRSGLGAMADRGVPIVFVEGPPRYYARFGFEPGATQGFRKPSLRIPDAAFQAIRLSPYAPWMTGTLVYAEAFWQHDAVGLRDPTVWEARG